MTAVLIIVGILAAAAVYLFLAWRKLRNQPAVPDSPRIKVLTEQNFAKQTSKGTVLVDFWAAWCMPCRMMTPVLNEIAEENGDKVTVGKVNVDEQQGIARKFGIRGIPTMIVFRDGREVERIVGVKQKGYILQRINS